MARKVIGDSAEEERKKIVAWLRKITYLKDLADRLEVGDHWTNKKRESDVDSRDN